MLIYLAGPIRPKDGKTMEENVAYAKSVALELWKMGYAVICPHANTDLPISLADKECEENIWLNGDKEMLLKCDALVLLPNYRGSKGTEGECEFALANGIPIYKYPDDLPDKRRLEMTKQFECTIDWKNIALFDFEKVFSAMRGLKIPMMGNELKGIESKIPDSIEELQQMLAEQIELVLGYIGYIYPSREEQIKTWRFGPFLYLFNSSQDPHLTIAFAPFVTWANIILTKEVVE